MLSSFSTPKLSKNSIAMLSIRERIDQLEEQALENGSKNLIRTVFSLKRMISHLYRLMIEEKDFMFDVDKSMVALTNLNQKSKPIVDEAIEREVDLILISVTYKTRFGEFSLGDVVPYVLKNAPCRVILYHQPIM